MPILINKQYPHIYLTIKGENKKNLMTTQMLAQLDDYVKQAEQDGLCRYIVILGGNEYFCFGGSLGDYQKNTDEENKAFIDNLAEVHKTLAYCQKITIAGVDGHAGGCGFSFTELCDFAIASQKATFSLPEVIANRVPMISINAVANIFSRKRCMKLAFFGTEITATEALECDVISKIAVNSIDEEILSLTKQLDSINIEHIKAFKRYYNNLLGENYNKQFEDVHEPLKAMLEV